MYLNSNPTHNLVVVFFPSVSSSLARLLSAGRPACQKKGPTNVGDASHPSLPAKGSALTPGPTPTFQGEPITHHKLQPCQTRYQSLLRAASEARIPSPPPALPSLLSPAELGSSTRVIIEAFIRIGVRLDRLCPHCHDDLHRLAPYSDGHYRDGIRLRCHYCKGDWAVRTGSVLEHFQSPLSTIEWIMRAFKAGLTITMTCDEHELERHMVSHAYKVFRERCQLYIHNHPILFPPDEIVEIDELYLTSLQEELEMSLRRCG